MKKIIISIILLILVGCGYKAMAYITKVNHPIYCCPECNEPYDDSDIIEIDGIYYCSCHSCGCEIEYQEAPSRLQ